MTDINLQCTIHKYSFEELDKNDQDLIRKAMKATDNSYAPYSGFSVGAAVLMDNGRVYVGANQENAAYPSGLCAERTAIFAAHAQHPNDKIVSLAIAARNRDGFIPKPAAPCGACRQVILESEMRYSQPIKILLYGTEAVYVIDTVRDILPLQFTADNLAL